MQIIKSRAEIITPMREVTLPLLSVLHEIIPVVFDDVMEMFNG